MVDIYVGSKKQHFRIHKKILCQMVPYSERIFKGSSEEDMNYATHFGESPRELDIILGWVYHNTLPALHKKEGTRLLTWSIARLYSIAEKMCLPRLQDMVIDAHLSSLELIGLSQV
jgi:hypothetical protein